jgi:UDP-glucuronate decarboxylase
LEIPILFVTYQFVHDLISGLIALMGSSYSETPVNIGTTDEATVEDWARAILSIVNEMRQNGTIPPLPEGKKESEIIFVDKVVDDPPRRKPDTTLAKNVLNWEPRWTVKAGLEETIRYFVTVLEEGEH